MSLTYNWRSFLNRAASPAAFHGIGSGNTIWVLPAQERGRIALVWIANKMTLIGYWYLTPMVGRLDSAEILAPGSGLRQDFDHSFPSPSSRLRPKIQNLHNTGHHSCGRVGNYCGYRQYFPMLASTILLDQTHTRALYERTKHVFHCHWYGITGPGCAHSMPATANSMEATCSFKAED